MQFVHCNLQSLFWIRQNPLQYLAWVASTEWKECKRLITMEGSRLRLLTQELVLCLLPTKLHFSHFRPELLLLLLLSELLIRLVTLELVGVWIGFVCFQQSCTFLILDLSCCCWFSSQPLLPTLAICQKKVHCRQTQLKCSNTGSICLESGRKLPSLNTNCDVIFKPYILAQEQPKSLLVVWSIFILVLFDFMSHN